MRRVICQNKYDYSGFDNLFRFIYHTALLVTFYRENSPYTGQGGGGRFPSRNFKLWLELLDLEITLILCRLPVLALCAKTENWKLKPNPPDIAENTAVLTCISQRADILDFQSASADNLCKTECWKWHHCLCLTLHCCSNLLLCASFEFTSINEVIILDSHEVRHFALSPHK